MTTIVVSYAPERFGHTETAHSREPYSKNRRVTKIQLLCQELRSLKRQYKGASEEERLPLADHKEETPDDLQSGVADGPRCGHPLLPIHSALPGSCLVASGAATSSAP